MADKSTSKLSKADRIHVPPKERVEFNQLVALNPNYFGNLIDSPLKVVKKMVGNTTYEEVSCVGFNPDLNLLEATVQIKLPGGYNGLLCAPGSTEYVRFYIDYGGGWEDAGLAAFNSHDIPNTLDCANKKDKPLTYVVTALLDPKRDYCTTTGPAQGAGDPLLADRAAGRAAQLAAGLGQRPRRPHPDQTALPLCRRFGRPAARCDAEEAAALCIGGQAIPHPHSRPAAV